VRRSLTDAHTDGADNCRFFLPQKIKTVLSLAISVPPATSPPAGERLSG
jgi:hypothetical protein